ncbi:MAG TPA: DUF3693 domain-containing protein [Oleiagrimonas sp.]|nr:DUF3693 domain-containing protein [Oleiagrimonas sp.]
MSATYELFQEWKKHNGISSDYKGALALGISRGTASLWKSGRNAEAHLIAKMADNIGEDKGAWMAAVQAEKTNSPKERKEWLNLAKRLGYAAAITLAVGAFYPVQAGTATQASGYFSAHKSPTLYIMSNKE